MKTILLLGAGLSSSSLINYFLGEFRGRYRLRVGDLDPQKASRHLEGFSGGEPFRFDIYDIKQRTREIQEADIVVSLLPARMHPLVGEACVRAGRHMVTASYLSPAILAMDRAARKKGIILMNECGVDPGIDHMSAMNVIDRIRSEGSDIRAFESSTGGLIAPGYEKNPWQYKFTWNPRNVVLAGMEGARFLHNGKFKYIPYHKVFQRAETIRVPELGAFEVYPNRDSLTYRHTYRLDNLQTMFRGTIRRPGFCQAWDTFVQLGATDDSYVMEHTDRMTYREFINSFMAFRTDIPVETKLAHYLGFRVESAMMKRLQWLGIFENRMIGVPGLTPARILQKILEEKWRMEKGDRDMILMQHQFDVQRRSDAVRVYSTMVSMGENDVFTAMAKTVGLPLAMVTRRILEGSYKATGARLPIHPDLYRPVLKELENFGIRFLEEEVKIPQTYPVRKGHSRT